MVISIKTGQIAGYVLAKLLFNMQLINVPVPVVKYVKALYSVL